MDWIDEVVQDVAELGYNSPEGQPDVMLVKASELRAILEERAPLAEVVAAERERCETQLLCEIALALQRHGLTLLKTSSGYDARKLGPILAQHITPDLSQVRRAPNGGDMAFGADIRRRFPSDA